MTETTVFAIVKGHGGFVTFESELGKGTRFRIYLPALSDPEQVRELEARQPPAPRGRGELILVVDDERAVREVARRVLERSGYRVLTATNGAEGVAAFAEHRDEIAAVITDMSMPIMGGPALVAALRALDPNIRLIGSSGAQEGTPLNLEHFLHKPYTAQTLLSTVHEALKGTPAPAPPTGHPGTVLLVEDEPALLKLMVRALQAEGYQVAGAESAERALKLLEEGGPVDLVFTDIRLPGMSGRELAGRVAERYPGVRVGFASGSGGGERPDVLPKPFTLDQLKAHVRRLLEP